MYYVKAVLHLVLTNVLGTCTLRNKNILYCNFKMSALFEILPQLCYFTCCMGRCYEKIMRQLEAEVYVIYVIYTI